MRPGINSNPITLLANVPVTTGAGACIAGDPQGLLDFPYLYYIIPAGNAATFWRFDMRTGAWQQLASPAVGANNVYGAGCALLVDGSAPTPFGGGTANVWLFHPFGVAPWANLQFYNAATDVWTAASQAGGSFAAAGLAAQWVSDAALAHPCTSLNVTVPASAVAPAAVADDYLVVGGNAATAFYRYTISTGTVTALAVHGGATSTGTALAWLPARQDRIYYIRGGGNTTMEYYSVAGNSWNAIAPIPVGTTFNTGTAMVADRNRDRMVVFTANRFYDFDGVNLTPLGTPYGNDGTVHVGSLLSVLAAGGNKYLYYGKHTHSEFQRLQIVE